jgi:osmotically inducible protein OsmC
MAVRNAEAEWNGSLKEGNGRVKLGSGAFEGQYSFSSRFESGTGTNPEELVGAAHAGCFTMALSAGLGKAGLTPTRLHTTAKVHLGAVEGAPTITQIDLDVTGEVPGIDAATFTKHAEDAKKGCLISRALSGVPTINLTATLA